MKINQIIKLVVTVLSIALFVVSVYVGRTLAQKASISAQNEFTNVSVINPLNPPETPAPTNPSETPQPTNPPTPINPPAPTNPPGGTSNPPGSTGTTIPPDSTTPTASGPSSQSPSSGVPSTYYDPSVPLEQMPNPPEVPIGPFDPENSPTTDDGTNPKPLLAGLAMGVYMLRQIVFMRKKKGVG